MEPLIAAAVVLICCCLVLPIVAIVRTGRIRALESRLKEVETALRQLQWERAVLRIAPPLPVPSPEHGASPPPLPPPDDAQEPFPPELPSPDPLPVPMPAAQSLETIIGRNWLGWIAVVLIFGAVAFFLKYAFENRWIGELGRVTLGVMVGLVFLVGGLQRHRTGWKYLSQVLTGGGVTILYLSVYGAFGYYHLLDQRSAFIFLAILVIEAHLLALLYNARAIAVMAIVGGFLVPIVLSTGRDQYVTLFSYIGVLDLGVLAVVMARRWRWVGSLAYGGTLLLFWGWYNQHYHPDKRPAALLFQLFVFLIFVAVDFAPRLRGDAAGWEELMRLSFNPFIFFGTGYFLLNGDHHAWMGVYALCMAIAYTTLARAEVSLGSANLRLDVRMLLVTIGVALTFVTIAIPVQLDSNWVAIAWCVEAVALLWAGLETSAPALRMLSALVFALAAAQYFFRDTPWDNRGVFPPILNRYFLETVVFTLCLGGAAYLYRRLPASRGSVIAGMLAAATFWLGSSLETYTYFDGRAQAAALLQQADAAQTGQQWSWAAQLALSLLWSVYAGILTTAGFRSRIREARIAGLTLFGLTLAKVLLIDISELRQFYRILAMLGLGLVLLGVAWAYQRQMRQERAE